MGDLFEKLNLKFLKTVFDKENDVSKEKTPEFDLPLINAKNGDNGIMYYGRSRDFESAEMTIDIVNDGAVSTGNVYSQPQKTGVLYNAYLVKPKWNVNEKLLHFLASTIQKSIKLKFGYENKASWEKVKEETVHLPVKNGAIDFDFMESFIAELEAERVAELEAYLSATGLKDYILTEDEERALAEFENGKFEWGEFQIGDLFEVKTVRGIDEGKLDLFEQREEKYIEFVGRTRNNNGIKGYVQKFSAEPNPANVISVSQIGTIVAQMRKNPWYASQNIFSLSQKEEYQNLILFYSIAVVDRSLRSTFSDGYANYPTLEKLRNLPIQLPVKSQTPDYAFMETFISAIQKIVIADVVKYADRKIETTKSVINKEN